MLKLIQRFSQQILVQHRAAYYVHIHHIKCEIKFKVYASFTISRLQKKQKQPKLWFAKTRAEIAGIGLNLMLDVGWI